MSCTSCKSKPATTHPFDAVFNRFWPPSAPFPPMAPTLAAAVSRTDARRWASAIGADQDPAVLAGGTMAVLDMVGRAMMDPGSLFSAQRHKSKKKKGGQGGAASREGPIMSTSECENWVEQNCTVSGPSWTATGGVCLPLGQGLSCGKCYAGFSTPDGTWAPSSTGTEFA